MAASRARTRCRIRRRRRRRAARSPSGSAWRRRRSRRAPSRVVDREAAFDHVAGVVLHHRVLDADVGEGAAHHDLMIAAARAVLVEVGDRDLALGQELARGRGGLDRAGRRDVVGGDLVAEQAEDARADDVADRLGLRLDAGEVGRVLDVGRGRLPGVGLAADRLDRLPLLIALEDVRVLLLEHLLGDGLVDEGLDFGVRRPDVLEEHRLALLVGAERLLRQVDLDRAGERIGDDQRRARRGSSPARRRDAALEVAVARQNGRGHHAVVVDRLRDFRGRGPELPMQVVQPKPTRLKPSLSRSFCRPDSSR